MRIQQFLLFICSLLLLGCNESKNEKLLLNGSNWQLNQLNNAKRYPATVPGTVQTELLKYGEIPDPFLLNNEDSVQWISEKDWVYTKLFSLTSETLEKKHHLLKFEGIDTYANISLNDSIILTTNNAFRSWEVDVSSLLCAENELSIVLKSVDDIEAEKAAQLAYNLPEAPRVFTRKPQFQYGWDWGPKIKTMGIFRDISIVSYDKVRLQDVYIYTTNVSEEKALLNAQIEVTGTDDGIYDIVIQNRTTGAITKIREELNNGSQLLETTLEIENPKRWWTHNLGNPHLYKYDIKLKKDGVTIDSKVQKVGVRTIELVTKKDTIGESFFFKLNGVPVYMKGANYIPQNIFLPNVTREDREKLLDDSVEANMNMLRVWGGGVYEDNSFYDLCDEKGILLWQDFMFACAMYPGDDNFLENVKAEAVDNVKRLRKHPSIALWCGNNENSEGWHRWGWQADKTEPQKEEIWNSYQAVFNDILPSVVDSLNPSISYWETSPKYGRGDKRHQFDGDAHDWWVWHDGYPFEHFEEEVPRFMSEFGFQSFPSYETIRYFTQLQKIDLSHPSFATHQKHSRGFNLIKEYMARDFPVPRNDEDYVYVSQLLQAHGISTGIKAHRLAKPYNMGTLYWQLNDCWPVVSWSSIDGLGNWKALHYEATRVFENVLIIPKEDCEGLDITIVDDNVSPHQPTTLSIAFKTFDGRVLKEVSTQNVTTNNLTNQTAMHIPLPDTLFKRNTVFAEITYGEYSSVYYFEKPKDLLLDSEQIEMSNSKLDAKYQLTLSAEKLQKNVFLTATVSGHFSDNFFDLLPGETKTIMFNPKGKAQADFSIKTLNGVQERLKIPVDFPLIIE